MEPSSVPPSLLHGDTICEDLQVPLDLNKGQLDAATRLSASRLSDLESVLADLAVTSAIFIRRKSTEPDFVPIIPTFESS